MIAHTQRQAAKHYANVHTTSRMGEDSPHRLIQLLMEGFMARINSAKGAIEHGDFEGKSMYISKAIGIVGGLNEAVDLDKGGDLAQNLRQLYDYMGTRLLIASAKNDVAILDECQSLMRDIKEAWDAIG
jgi:flagellar protein FliS